MEEVEVAVLEVDVGVDVDRYVEYMTMKTMKTNPDQDGAEEFIANSLSCLTCTKIVFLLKFFN